MTRRAGVSHGAPAHHFRNKAGLLTAFAAQGYESLARTVVDEIASTGGQDGADVLAAIGAVMSVSPWSIPPISR